MLATAWGMTIAEARIEMAVVGEPVDELLVSVITKFDDVWGSRAGC